MSDVILALYLSGLSVATITRRLSITRDAAIRALLNHPEAPPLSHDLMAEYTVHIVFHGKLSPQAWVTAP